MRRLGADEERGGGGGDCDGGSVNCGSSDDSDGISVVGNDCDSTDRCCCCCCCCCCSCCGCCVGGLTGGPTGVRGGHTSLPLYTHTFVPAG